ncbi:hypothetical protein niasHS_018033 [Heterodera schachtii]|uniref:Fido domain-containing protein n=1 Tax=Heterodera schachtii TaxID=97005 RepID=A0ABD2HZL7_HETSC
MNFQESLLREREIARNMTRYPSTYFDKDESYIGVFAKLPPGQITILSLMEINSEALMLQNPRAGGFIRRHGGMTIDGRRLTEGGHVWSELQEFIKELNVELEAEGADPVHVAAKYHMRMVYIHPFLDGNGRSARLLMYYILRRAGLRHRFFDRWQHAEYMRCMRENDLPDFPNLTPPPVALHHYQNMEAFPFPPDPQATVTTTIINMLLDGDWVFIKVRHLVVASSKQFIALNCAKSSEKRWTRGKSGKGGRRLALHERRGEKPHKTYSQLISMPFKWPTTVTREEEEKWNEQDGDLHQLLLHDEQISPRANLPPLLVRLADYRRHVTNWTILMFMDSASIAAPCSGSRANSRQRMVSINHNFTYTEAAVRSIGDFPTFRICGKFGRHLLDRAELRLRMSDLDLRRVAQYCRNLADLALISDLLPTIAGLYFTPGWTPTGLQRKMVETVANELALSASQTHALLNKAIRPWALEQQHNANDRQQQTEAATESEGKFVAKTKSDECPAIKKLKISHFVK